MRGSSTATIWAEPFNYTPGDLDGQGPWTTSSLGNTLVVQSAGNVINNEFFDVQLANIATGVITAFAPGAAWTLAITFTLSVTSDHYIELLLGDETGSCGAVYFNFDDHNNCELATSVNGSGGFDITGISVTNGTHILRVEVNASNETTVTIDGTAIITADTSTDWPSIVGNDATLIIDSSGTGHTATVNRIELRQ